jgi:hypothetical protein
MPKSAVLRHGDQDFVAKLDARHVCFYAIYHSSDLFCGSRKRKVQWHLEVIEIREVGHDE